MPAAAAPAKPGSLRERSLRGAIWTLLGFGLGQIVRLAGNIILAHFMTPLAFGLMNTVNLVQQGLSMLSDVGIGPSIVRHARGKEEVFLRTAWTVQVVRSVILTVVGLALAWPVAVFYGQSALAPLIALVCCTFLISGMTSTGVYTAQREIALGRLILIDLLTQVSGVVTMIAAAWVLSNALPILTNGVFLTPAALADHPGWHTSLVWALAFGSVGASATRLVLGHTLLKSIRHRFAWEADARKELLQFGRWILLATMLTFAAMQADRLVLPKLVDFHQVGTYSIALGLCVVPVEIVQRLGNGVLLAAYGEAQRKGKLPESVFQRVGFLTNTIAGFVIACLVAVAPELFRAFYPPAYYDSAIVLQAMAAVAWCRILQNNVMAALLAMGKPKGYTLANLVKLVVTLVLVPAGYFIARDPNSQVPGLIGATAGVATGELLKYAVLAHDSGKYGLRPLRRDLSASAYLGLVCVIVLGVHALLSPVRIRPIIGLAGGCTLVAVLYAPLLWKAYRMAGVREALRGWPGRSGGRAV